MGDVGCMCVQTLSETGRPLHVCMLFLKIYKKFGIGVENHHFYPTISKFTPDVVPHHT